MEVGRIFPAGAPNFPQQRTRCVEFTWQQFLPRIFFRSCLALWKCCPVRIGL